MLDLVDGMERQGALGEARRGTCVRYWQFGHPSHRPRGLVRLEDLRQQLCGHQ